MNLIDLYFIILVLIGRKIFIHLNDYWYLVSTMTEPRYEGQPLIGDLTHWIEVISVLAKRPVYEEFIDDIHTDPEPRFGYVWHRGLETVAIATKIWDWDTNTFEPVDPYLMVVGWELALSVSRAVRTHTDRVRAHVLPGPIKEYEDWSNSLRPRNRWPSMVKAIDDFFKMAFIMEEG